MNKLKIKWNFPLNNHGQEKGFSDSGLEHFNGKKLESLAREVCQNSLDAAESDDAMVLVEFQKYEIPSSNIPGNDVLNSFIDNTVEYGKLNKKIGEKEKLWLESLAKIKNDEKTYVLRVSDYNTTGLSKSDKFGNDTWYALVKSDGKTTKSGATAGSYGIGKSAFFANSHYRLVFFRTLNKQDQHIAQGIMRFVTFPKNMKKISETKTTGYGYYGNPVKNESVERIKELDDLNVRDKVGTDIFIYKFTGGKTWNKSILIELVYNFLVSLYNNKLKVIVAGEEISSKNLDNIIQKFFQTKASKIRNTRLYYDVLTNENAKVFSKSFFEKDDVVLRVVVNDDEKLNNKILVTRKIGMRLYESDFDISNIIQFSGVLEVNGEKMNEQFKKLEDPTHEKLRKSDDPETAKHINELEAWVKECVESLYDKESLERMEISLFSNVLSISGENGKKKESLEKEIKFITIESSSTSGSIKSKNEFIYQDNHENKNGSLDKEGYELVEIKGIKNNNVDNKRNLYGKENKNSEESIKVKVSKVSDKYVNEMRVIKDFKKDRKYTIMFSISKDLNKGYINLVSVGENEKTENLNIESFGFYSGCKVTRILNSNLIEFESIKANEKVRIRFSTVEDRDYIMGATINEYKE